MKHTKGKWSVNPKVRDLGHGFQKLLGFTIGNGLAFVPVPNAEPDHQYVEDEREAEANAFLISAAPEMLNALRKAKAALEHYEADYDYSHNEIYPDYDSILRAIKKAEGGES